MIADALNNFDLLLAVMLPIVDIIDGALLLQALQKSLILVLDPLRLHIPCISIE